MKETTQLPLNITTGEIVYRDKNQVVRQVTARFEGFTKEYLVSDHGERAAIVAVKNGEILLTRQYRLLINRVSFEIPGGKIEEGETPEAAAARECLEETGIACADVKSLLDFMSGLDIWQNHTFICYSGATQEKDKKLVDRRAWIPLARCIDMIFDRQITDSLSIIGIMAYDTVLRRRQP